MHMYISNVMFLLSFVLFMVYHVTTMNDSPSSKHGMQQVICLLLSAAFLKHCLKGNKNILI